VRDKKIAKNIVATMAIYAFEIRSSFFVGPAGFQDQGLDAKIAAPFREARLSDRRRTRRSLWQAV
jgi:hypothetical protein